MRFRKIRLFLSRGWTFIVCSISVVVLGLMASCRSKKVIKTAEVTEKEDNSQELVTDEYFNSRNRNGFTPMAVLPGDSQEIKDMIRESNSLKENLSGRMRSVIYGTPEIMERRAQENAQMRHKIDSLDTEIIKARQK